MLAVINATGRHAKNVEEFQHAITERVHSLAKTHSLLIEADTNEVALQKILLSQLAPYASDGKLELGGPKLVLSAEVAQTLGMAVHELATNSAKYGSLSVPQGRLRFTWAAFKQQGRR